MASLLFIYMVLHKKSGQLLNQYEKLVGSFFGYFEIQITVPIQGG